MLVLRRRIGESITIGDNIEVTVLSVRGRQVRLGANAPEHVPIDRTELRIERSIESGIKKESAVIQ